MVTLLALALVGAGLFVAVVLLVAAALVARRRARPAGGTLVMVPRARDMPRLRPAETNVLNLVGLIPGARRLHRAPARHLLIAFALTSYVLLYSRDRPPFPYVM